jgi:opacity protein-like surface antigen
MMNKKRSFAATTGVAALLASAVVADAAPNIDSGTYRGKTNKGDRITFKISKSKKLFRFTHKGVRMKCSDGRDFTITDRLSSGKKRLTVLDDGRFGFTVEYTGGGYWKVRGKIKGNRATGTLRVKIRFNSNDEPDPDGSVRCSSGKLRFKAKHRRV